MSTTIESLELKIRSNSTDAVKGIDALTQSLNRLKTATAGLSGLASIATNMKGIGDSSKKVADAMNKASEQNKKTSTSFTDVFHKVGFVVRGFKAVKSTIDSFIKASSEHNEAVNLFTVSLGEYADEATTYAEAVSDIMGINTTEWLKNQGIVMTLATGFGVASDRAYTMSQNLTQLAYDLSSFYNIGVDDAMQKVQSGLAGELEPLRRIGYDLSMAKLEATALELGIDKSVSSMSQAEKAQLRYYAIMTQVNVAHGDMARTLDAPANQMRVLKSQFQMAAISIGNVFIPALQAILPYAIAVTKIVREMADGLASLVGYEPTGVDSTIAAVGNVASDTSSALEEGAESAKKLKSYMLGFDELNVINPNSDASTEESSGFDFALPEYDFLSGATNEKIEGTISAIKKAFEPLSKLIEKTVGWAKELDLEPITKEFKGFASSLDRINKEVFETLSWVYEDIMLPLAKWSFEKGLPALIDGVAASFDLLGSAMEPVHEGLKELKKDLEPIVEWIGEVVIVALEGITSVFEKLARVFSEKAPEIKSIFTGIGAVVSNLWAGLAPIANAVLYVFGLLWDLFRDFAAINWTYLIDMVSSLVDIFAGIANGDWGQVWSGIVGVFDAEMTAFTDRIKAVWDFIVELFTPVAKWFSTHVIQPIKKFFKGLWESVSGFFTSLWDDIVAVWNTVATWFDETVVQPIVAFFAPIVGWISDFFTGCWLIIQAVWLVVATWFNDNVVTPVVDYFKGLWTDVSSYFSSLWEDIKKVWRGVSAWFKKTVITPTVDFFKGLWEEVAEFFSSLWEDIKAVWVGASKWFGDTIVEPVKTAFKVACEAIEGFFTSLWLSIRRGVASAMNGVIDGIESAINWIIGGINAVIGSFDQVVEWAADVLGKDWSGMTLVKEVSLQRITVPTYAEGGFPEQGQMFIAREAGAEMVGNIGRRTAVANNDQIVAGIAGGVAEANEEQNVLLREQNSLLRAILEKDTGTYLDGKSLTGSVEKYQRERGRVLIAGGVI